MLGLRSYPVTFKEVFTSRTVDIHINPCFTLTQFIETVRPHLSSSFGINQNELDIVEAGQYRNCLMPERAPALAPSGSQLSSHWGENLDGLSFYVRRKNYQYPEFQVPRISLRTNGSSGITISSDIYSGDCPICLETTSISRRYMCSHGVCLQCYQHCQSRSITICSLCRSP